MAHVAEHIRRALTGMQAGWVMVLLAALSALSVALMAERALLFRALRDDLEALTRNLAGRLGAGDYPGALALLQASPSPAAATVAVGLQHAPLGPLAAERAMAGAAAAARPRLERGLAALGTLGNNAPFVGLLGTVMGVIEAFEALGQAAGADDGVASSQAVMRGISEALVATAVGLLVALPAVVAYNAFQRQVAAHDGHTEALAGVLLAHLYAEGEP